MIRWEIGATSVLNSRGTLKYVYLGEFGQQLAVLDYRWDAGSTSVNFEVRGYAGPS